MHCLYLFLLMFLFAVFGLCFSVFVVYAVMFVCVCLRSCFVYVDVFCLLLLCCFCLLLFLFVCRCFVAFCVVCIVNV